MGQETIQVLLIEDNPDDARLIGTMLTKLQGTSLSLKLDWVGRLSEGLSRLSEGDVDLILLDLALPDSQGLDTVELTRQYAIDVPILVLTGLDDAAVSLKALEKGADDYLLKEQLSGPLLLRAIRHTLELVDLRLSARREFKLMLGLLQDLDTLNAESPAWRGGERLQEQEPDRFAELVEQLGGLIERSRDEEIEMVQDQMALAKQLASLGAGPGDLTDILVTALVEWSETNQDKLTKADCIELVQTLVYGLLGHLSSCYLDELHQLKDSTSQKA